MSKYCFSHPISLGFHPPTSVLVLLNLTTALDTADHDILIERFRAWLFTGFLSTKALKTYFLNHLFTMSDLTTFSVTTVLVLSKRFPVFVFLPSSHWFEGVTQLEKDDGTHFYAPIRILQRSQRSILGPLRPNYTNMFKIVFIIFYS